MIVYLTLHQAWSQLKVGKTSDLVTFILRFLDLLIAYFLDPDSTQDHLIVVQEHPYSNSIAFIIILNALMQSKAIHHHYQCLLFPNSAFLRHYTVNYYLLCFGQLCLQDLSFLDLHRLIHFLAHHLIVPPLRQALQI